MREQAPEPVPPSRRRSHDGRTSSRHHNPILRGFNPDPSIVRVGDDYYIATSTFEWFPGVQIHHSRDLVALAAGGAAAQPRESARHARRSRFVRRLGAVPDPCRRAVPSDLHRREALRPHHDGRRVGRSLRDFHNYLVTSPRIDGEWSDPVYLNSSGLRSVALPRRRRAEVSRQHAVGPPAGTEPLRRHRAAGVLAGDADCCRRAPQHLHRHRHRLHRGAAPLQARRLVLPAHRRGRHRLGARRDDGAFADAARARTSCIPTPTSSARVIVPTSRCSARAMPTSSRRSRERPTWSISAAGRCANRGRCTLGRETAIQPMTWGRRRLAAHDRWRRRSDRGGAGAGGSGAAAASAAPVREDFDGETLPIDFQWLRSPWPDDLFSLRARPGHLRLYGRETIGSLFTQALVARRQQAHCFSASTIVEFEPAALPADGRPGLLLQQHQVPLPLRVARRGRQAPARDVGAARLR